VPVSFLSLAQRESYGRYTGAPCGEDLSRYFHLDDADREAIMQKRGDHNRLGFALQLTTVRFLGTFLEEPTAVPLAVVQFVARQINVDDTDCLLTYAENRQRWMHTVEIRTRYDYREFTTIHHQKFDRN
jgi:TnpA family transposase